jgi:hypothetical protein
MERNQFLEMDGLFWESETHEWFKQLDRFLPNKNPIFK